MSFIQYDRSLNRYHLHELLRQYGAGRLASDPAHEEEVHDRHSVYFCQWLALQEENVKGAGQREAVTAIKADLDKIDLPEVAYFLNNFVPSFNLTLDELN